MNSRLQKRFLMLLVVFTLTAALINAFGSREKNVSTVQITGIVRLTGTAHFPEIVISGAEDTWVIASEETDKLYELQHRTVTIEAQETIIELKFANGMPAGIRRELKNVRIISIH
ncbi:MAG: hypothetical protein FWD40_06785 [Treponema sp.]|nr:hypothetical protein [Treponema sp.]